MSPERKKSTKILLKALNKLKKDELNVLMDNFNDNGVNHVCEIFHNILHNNIRPTKSKLPALKKHMIKNRKNIEFLSKFSPKKRDIEEKRKILQSGGFPLIPILSAVVPAIISAISSA